MNMQWSDKTYIMGIVNVTPDSFSGDGLYEKSLEIVMQQVDDFVNDGVDILDIGGESTRPGSDPVTTEDELKRVIPVIKAIRAKYDIPVSIDTYKAVVAEEALKAGATMINDVWGFLMDEKMASVAAKYNCPVILMHNRSKPKDVSKEDRLGGRFVGVEYNNLPEDIKKELQISIDLALEKGVKRENIILDVGIGFGKTVEQNLELVNRLDEFQSMNYPILLGPSRKSFIGYTLDLPPEERLEGTMASVVIGIMKGANIIRVHDVREMVRLAKMTDAILRS